MKCCDFTILILKWAVLLCQEHVRHEGYTDRYIKILVAQFLVKQRS